MKELIITKNNLQELITKEDIEYNINNKELTILIQIDSLTIDLPELLILNCCRNKLIKLNIDNLINLQKLNC